MVATEEVDVQRELHVESIGSSNISSNSVQ